MATIIHPAAQHRSERAFYKAVRSGRRRADELIAQWRDAPSGVPVTALLDKIKPMLRRCSEEGCRRLTATAMFYGGMDEEAEMQILPLVGRVTKLAKREVDKVGPLLLAITRFDRNIARKLKEEFPHDYRYMVGKARAHLKARRALSWMQPSAATGSEIRLQA